MDSKKSNLNPLNQPIQHSQAEMIQFIDHIDQLDENQKNYLMVVLFAEGTKPLEMDLMAKVVEDSFCRNWLETNTQFDYDRFQAMMRNLAPVSEELQKGTDTFVSTSESSPRREEMIEHYRQVHAEEIKESREEDGQ